MPRLSKKQRVFVEHYLQSFNAADAARKAGYSEHSARSIGHENLTKPHILALIEERMSQVAMGADEVLTRLASMARGEVPTKTVGTKDSEIEHFEPKQALELLGKIHGLFRERHEHSGPDGEPIPIVALPDNGRNDRD